MREDFSLSVAHGECPVLGIMPKGRRRRGAEGAEIKERFKSAGLKLLVLLGVLCGLAPWRDVFGE